MSTLEKPLNLFYFYRSTCSKACKEGFVSTQTFPKTSKTGVDRAKYPTHGKIF